LALTDAAPLLIAQERRFFARHGVDVDLSCLPAWSGLRDRVAFGQLDGAQMLAPMPQALSLGLGGVQRTMSVAATLSRNGNTIVISRALMGSVVDCTRPLPSRALAPDLAKRGTGPAVFAVVFGFSAHNYLLRHWLALGGIDPDRDVRLIVLPPAQVVDQLANGAIDGFCAGEPWGSLAVARGVGHIAATSADIWPDHPEKVLAFGEGVDAGAMVAATAAVIEAAQWADEPAHRAETVRLLAQQALPDVAEDVIARILDGGLAFDPGGPVLPVRRMVFGAGGASFPAAGQGAWYYTQMQRWGHLTELHLTDQMAPDVWRADIWTQAAARLGLAPPAANSFQMAPAA
jgi:ABC-type nitrate/sulfonate/bicarbonate transport system substrate-binding protein